MDKLSTIKIQLDSGAHIPSRAYERDAGADLHTPGAFTLFSHNSIIIDTGVHVDIPEGYVGLLMSKSGLNTNYDITSTGVIDSGYTGSIKVKLYNHGVNIKKFEAGDKITQLLIVPVETPKFEVVSYLEGGERGDNGFGSTGK